MQVGPFLFALVAMTALIFLNAVAREVEGLVGKGLPWTAIAEFLVLSLPHTVALSLPIAVLAAVLYSFSDLTSSSEVTALAANGVSPFRILAPVLALGIVATAVMLAFNDRILPEANHQLKNLTYDMGRKSPTLELREQVVNRIQTEIDGRGRLGTYFLTADRIDSNANELESIGIFDVNNPARKRVTYAEKGRMAFNESQTDLFLTLEDGVVQELVSDRIGGFRLIYFDREIIPLRNVGTMFEQGQGSSRSDREMGFALLRANADAKLAELDSVKAESQAEVSRAIRLALGRASPSDEAVRQEEIARRTGGVAPSVGEASSLLAGDPGSQAAILAVRQRAASGNRLSQRMGQFQVEIHKKAALAVACLIFTLLGPPLAIRFPSGGVGMVVAAAGSITAVYWAGLIGGENLADRGAAGPAVTMWATNAIFLGMGLWLALTMGRTRISLRSNRIDDLASAIFGRSRPANAPERAR